MKKESIHEGYAAGGYLQLQMLGTGTDTGFRVDY